jgi:hypothetical protein
MVDALNRLPNPFEPIGVPNQNYNVHMFILQPKWIKNVYEYTLEGIMPKRFTTSQ